MSRHLRREPIEIGSKVIVIKDYDNYYGYGNDFDEIEEIRITKDNVFYTLKSGRIRSYKELEHKTTAYLKVNGVRYINDNYSLLKTLVKFLKNEDYHTAKMWGIVFDCDIEFYDEEKLIDSFKYISRKINKE